ncbi:prion-like-(Q/N-rich) domain-bearing protein 25 [Belonocnema kinseyi]|uniref:prion-like-(Q/N-rich) domain-bearing protein 25 n=1 Tax=Belonocnema kinseyi TaxID=2817044 RepID=UPI00143CD9AF|nr:prion-like-(Q/N-rich) domain-bearing protein 25 [Belonocnema kinseyi]
MKSSIVCTIFLFVSTFGQYTAPSIQENISLLRNVMPCSSDSECQSKVGSKSKCKFYSCVCPLDGQWRDCPMDENIVSQARNNPESYIGDQCESDKNCKISDSFCNEQTKRCECVKEHIPSHDKAACLKGIAQQLGDNCNEDSECQVKFPNATCSAKKICECRENYHAAENHCWKNIGLAEKCGDTRECNHIGAHCNETSKICDCEDKTVVDEKRSRCLNIVGHKGKCLENIQCTQSLNNSQCIDGLCTCNTNYHYAIMQKNCIKSKVFGDPCQVDEDCNQITGADNENSIFCGRSKTCDCKKGYERALNGKMCFKFMPSSASGLYPAILVLATIFLFLL